MVSETQASHIRALVKERHQAVKSDFSTLIDAYAKSNQEEIFAASEKLRGSLNDLRSVIASNHCPGWLSELISHLESYATRHNKGLGIWRSHLDCVIRNVAPLQTETWAFDDAPIVVFDVDSIINDASSAHHVEQKYEGVITSLRELLETGNIDSVRACSDLSQIIQTLQSARDGSFASKVFSWQFARRMIANLISEYVKDSFAGPFVEAFKKTASELDVSLDRAKKQIAEEIILSASQAMKTGNLAEIEYRDTLTVGRTDDD